MTHGSQAGLPAPFRKGYCANSADTFGWSLSNLAALIRYQLFVYRDLFAWLNAPFEGPP